MVAVTAATEDNDDNLWASFADVYIKQESQANDDDDEDCMPPELEEEKEEVMEGSDADATWDELLSEYADVVACKKEEEQEEEMEEKCEPPKKRRRYELVDLFAGCGGLSSGFEGRCNVRSFDFNKVCVKILQQRHEATLAKIEVDTVGDLIRGKRPVDIVVGGPPCQPFSTNGVQRGKNDVRDGLPAFFQAIKEARPKAFLMENVPNTIGQRHADHIVKLIRDIERQGYHVTWKTLDASYYRVPQRRRRLFVVGFKRKRYMDAFRWPKPTQERMTVRDVFPKDKMWDYEIPELMLDAKRVADIVNWEHGAKPRHLWPDEPAKTFTCANLRGYNTEAVRWKLSNGSYRVVTVTEACKLQTIPVEWMWGVLRNHAMTCIGNSVPPVLAHRLARQIFKALDVDDNI